MQMPEKIYTFSTTDKTTVERLVDQATVRINHLSLASGESIEPHVTREAAHFIVTRGILSLKLNEGAEHTYPEGKIIEVKAGSMLAIANHGNETMHLFVIKTEKL